MQTELAPLGRVRRDGWADPGIEHTTTEDDARAAIMAAKGALREHTVALHVAGCHEAAAPLLTAMQALDACYPQLPVA